MKKLLLVSFSFIISLNIVLSQNEIDYSLARVGFKIHGVYVFIKSEPVAEYVDVATLNVGVKDTKRQTFEKAVKKAKAKYHNFNGMVFRYSDLTKVDLIRFKGLPVITQGIKVFDKVVFADGSNVSYGSVIDLKDDKYCKVKCLNEYGEEKVKLLPYEILTVINDSIYTIKHSQLEKQSIKHKFQIGDKVIWIKGIGPTKESYRGTIIGFSRDHHKANVELLKDNKPIAKRINVLELSKIAPD